MTKNEAKALLPILQAYADGKKLQYYNCGEWTDVKDGEDLSLINYPKKYRIKPEPKYRPFNNALECWGEMQKHEPFGWVKSKDVGDYYHLGQVNDEFDKEYCFLNFTFPDGSVFGKQTEEE